MSSDIARTPYSADFYAGIKDHSAQSADRIVPFVVELLRPSSVVDVGCGEGSWLASFRATGVEDVLGLDGDYVPRDALAIPDECFQPADLSRPLSVGRRFDLAMSVEVAEHLPEARAASFVADLCGLAPVVLFSAAIPGQGGTDHVNEQWPSYWAAHFERQGYRCLDILRPRFWHDAQVMWWYRQNVLLFLSAEVEIDLPTPLPLDAVHPDVYTAWRDACLQPPLRAILRAAPSAARESLKWHGQRLLRGKRGR